MTAASLDASYAPSAHIQLFATYSEGISTAAEQLQSSLAGVQFDALGHPVNAQTGAPLQLTDNFFGVTDAVYRTRSASFTAAWQRNRDSVQATVNSQQNTPVGTQPAGVVPASATSGTYGALTWQHDISAVLKSTLYFQYGVEASGSGAARVSNNLVVASASLSYALSDTLSGTAQYSYSSNAYGIPQNGGARTGQLTGQAVNLVVLGLRKTF